MDPITLSLAALQLGSGVYGLTQAQKIPKELKELYDLLQGQAKYGIPGPQESVMRSSGAGQIARYGTGLQARGSAALASRGMGRSSLADTMVAGVNRTQAEMFQQLQSNIAALDEQTKARAQGQLGGVATQIAGLKQAQESAGWQMIFGGLGRGMEMFEPTEMEDFEQKLMLLQEYGFLPQLAI